MWIKTVCCLTMGQNERTWTYRAQIMRIELNYERFKGGDLDHQGVYNVMDAEVCLKCMEKFGYTAETCSTVTLPEVGFSLDELFDA